MMASLVFLIEKMTFCRTICKATVNIFLITATVSSFAQEFKVVGYLPHYRFDLIDQIELNKITHLNIAFANPSTDGGLATPGGASETVVDIKPIVEIAHDAGLSVFISLGGGAAVLAEWENLIAVTNRSEFIHKIMTYTLENDLQGIDVDLEWNAVNADYTGFVLELRDSLDKYDLKMTAALPGTFRYPEVTDDVLVSYDWVNMMAYDLRGPWNPSNPGPHSPYEFAQDAISYWVAQGALPEKLTLGVPFYGYDFSDLNNVTARTYAAIVAQNPDNALEDQVGEFYYNGLRTIGHKTALALREVSGIMIWELGQDSFGEYSLLNKIHEVIQMPVGLEKHIRNVEIDVFPVPFNDKINVRFEQVPSILVSVSLMNLNGSVLLTTELDGQSALSINTDHFPNGVYIIEIHSSKFVLSRKLVKE